MKFASALLSVASVLVCSTDASPVVKRAAPTDTDILQYALTLEHLENAFYSGGLAKYDQAAFVAAGLPSFARRRFTEISAHEASHVAVLESVIGDKANKPCEYSFPYTDAKSFAGLAMVLEGVGSSAYLGAAGFITDKTYLTAAGSILVTEARHSAWLSSAVLKGEPWSSAYETPLTLNQVYSLAASFITSCPSTNQALPVMAFPALAVTGTAKPGQSIQLKFDAASTDDLFLAIFSGLSTTYVPIDSDKKATLPSMLAGTVYAVVTKTNGTVTDSSTVAGPAIMRFPF